MQDRNASHFLDRDQDRNAVAKEVLSLLLLAPEELRAAGAPLSAIAAAEEIAKTAKRLLSAHGLERFQHDRVRDAEAILTEGVAGT